MPWVQETDDMIFRLLVGANATEQKSRDRTVAKLLAWYLPTLTALLGYLHSIVVVAAKITLKITLSLHEVRSRIVHARLLRDQTLLEMQSCTISSSTTPKLLLRSASAVADDHGDIVAGVAGNKRRQASLRTEARTSVRLREVG